MYSAVALRQLTEVEQLMYSVYAIYNPEHEKIYIGQTENLHQRLVMHAEKTFTDSYTARFDGKWIVIYSEDLPSRKESLARERQLKS